MFLTKAYKLMLSCLKYRFGIISLFFLLRHVLLCLICLFETASLQQNTCADERASWMKQQPTLEGCYSFLLTQSEPHNAVEGGLELCIAGVLECKWS